MVARSSAILQHGRFWLIDSFLLSLLVSLHLR